MRQDAAEDVVQDEAIHGIAMARPKSAKSAFVGALPA
jgi:hypothetical protein